MKTHIALIVAVLTALVSTQAADTPAAIAADYRSKADTALERVNTTLDAEAAKISQTLLALGDAAAVEKLAEQVKAKRAGDPVAQPVPQAAALFSAYDAARVKALSPVTESTLRRIEATLASSEGKKTEVVAELAKLKTDVQAGRVPPAAPKVPIEWTYHSTATSSTVMATVKFLPDGTFEMSNQKPAKWRANSKGDQITITLADKSVWKVKIDGKIALIERPDIGTRYLKLAQR